MNRDINFDIDLENDVEINIEATGFSSSYQDLTNKPKINDVEINGNKTSSDFNIYSKDEANTLLNLKADKSELEDYVKFTDKASTNDFGIVKPDGNTIKINNDGTLGVVAGQGDPSNYQNLVGKPSINNVTLEGGNTDSDTLDLVKKSKLQKEEQILNTNEDNPIDINYGSLVVNGNSYQETTTGKNLFNNISDITFNSNVRATTIPTGKKIEASGISYPYVTIVIDKDMTPYAGKTIRLKTEFTKSVNTLNPKFGLLLSTLDYSSRELKAESSTSGNTISFTLPTTFDDKKYLALRLYITNGNCSIGDYVEYSNIIITIDNNDMTYEPYTGGQPSPSPNYPQAIETINSVSIKVENDLIESTVPINLQNNELCKLPNGVKDELIIENGKVKIIKRVGKTILNGLENWRILDDRTFENTSYYTSNVLDNFAKGTTSYIISNYFKYENGIWSSDIEGMSIVNQTRKLRLRIITSLASSVANLNSWLSTHNTEVYYELATPTEIDLGTITNINFKDYNYISVLTNLDSTYKLISYNKDFDYINLLSDKIDSNKSSITTLNNSIVNKVDKVEGKGLSTNDFTTDDKNNLDLNTENRHTHANKSVLDSITTSMITKLNNIVVNTLWTNPDDTVNFTAQQVELSDSLENYNLLVIIIRDSTQDTNYHTTIIAKNDDIFEDYYDRRYVENVSATRQRKYGAVTNTMYSFTNSTDTEGTSRSGSLVPVKIIGIRI